MATGAHRIIRAGYLSVGLAAVPQPLTPATQPCSLVWVGPASSLKFGIMNTTVARIGIEGVGNQRIALHWNSIEGVMIPCSDTNDLYVNVGADHEGVDYVIYA